jgi:hypothetical protein
MSHQGRLIQMLGSLYIGSDGFEELEAFASRLFALLDVPYFEVRHSDNYFGGKYVLAKSLGLRVRLSLADDSEFKDTISCSRSIRRPNNGMRTEHPSMG